MSNWLCGRLDEVKDKDEENLKKLILDHGESYLVVRENGGKKNPHFHWAMATKLTVDQFRTRLTYVFKDRTGRGKDKGNGAYMLKTMLSTDELRAPHWNYLCKGACEEELPEVILAYGLLFTLDKLADYHALFYELRRTKYQKGKRGRDTSEKGTVMEQLVNRCRERRLTARDSVEICKEMLVIYREKEKGYTSYEAERNFKGCLLQLDDESGSYVQLEAEFMARKFGRL